MAEHNHAYKPIIFRDTAILTASLTHQSFLLNAESGPLNCHLLHYLRLLSFKSLLL